jgi:hypothetical protein
MSPGSDWTVNGPMVIDTLSARWSSKLKLSVPGSGRCSQNAPTVTTGQQKARYRMNDNGPLNC